MPARASRVLTAAPTAFHDDGSLDLDASRAVLRFAAESGVDGAFVTGTMGEFPALERSERDALTRIALEELDGLETIVHVGAASAFEVRALLADARAAGVARAAAITPYYLPATADDVLAHFAGLAAEADGIDLYAYLFRSLTGVAVEPELLAEIEYRAKSAEGKVRHPFFRGIREDL